MTQKVNQLDSKNKKKFDLIIVLDNLRSASNVGNIYRLAEALNLKAIYPCGYTPYPPHPKIIKTSRNTQNDTPTHHFKQTITACEKLKNEGYQLIAIETIKNAQDLWNFSFFEKIAIILGNEALGISQDVLEICDFYLSLNLYGKKNSINVSNCASVVLFKAINDFK